tara:strand:- start:49 stop:834 length:786 start_codon:yes stop_codon:yes gene_type:complete
MSEILNFFYKTKNQSIKYKKYFNVYETVFKKFKEKKITFVEIGLFHGGSLEIWRNYFGKEARIIGIDNNPECKKFEKDGFEIFIGDQNSDVFWKDFFKKVGNVDIILDDGGHSNNQQISTTINTIPNINDNGLLIIEDTHTSYMQEFGNPHKYNFINFSKKIVDEINYKFFSENKKKFFLNNYIYSTQFYESICIFYVDRKLCTNNEILMSKGNATISANIKNETSSNKFKNKIKRNKIAIFLYQKIFLYLKNFSLRKYFN